MSHYDGIDGKVAVVTGFGSGIGQAVAMLLAAEGARIVGLSRTPEAGRRRWTRYAAGAGRPRSSARTSALPMT